MKTGQTSQVRGTSFVVVLLLLAFFGIVRTSVAQSNCGPTYTARIGDTLAGVAAKCTLLLSSLQQANPSITDPDLVITGQIINIPRSTSPPGTYTVKSGDTLSKIAASLGVSLSDLEAANPQISNPGAIHPGQVINVPAAIPVTGNSAQPVSGSPSGAPGTTLAIDGQTIYIVKRGDDLTAIAARHDVSLAALKQANPSIANPNLIFPGQQVVIP